MTTYIYGWEFKNCVLIPTQRPPIRYISNMCIIFMLNPTSSSSSSSVCDGLLWTFQRVEHFYSCMQLVFRHIPIMQTSVYIISKIFKSTGIPFKSRGGTNPHEIGTKIFRYVEFKSEYLKEDKINSTLNPIATRTKL